MNRLSINELQFENYENAINNVIDVLNDVLKTDFDFIVDDVKFNELALRLNLKFDKNGNLVK